MSILEMLPSMIVNGMGQSIHLSLYILTSVLYIRRYAFWYLINCAIVMCEMLSHSKGVVFYSPLIFCTYSGGGGVEARAFVSKDRTPVVVSLEDAIFIQFSVMSSWSCQDHTTLQEEILMH